MIASKRIYLTADRSRVVDVNDPKAAVLLVGEGGTISDEDVERYGLTEDAPNTGPLAADAEPTEESAEKKSPKAPAKKK